jgi:hypothetical protein
MVNDESFGELVAAVAAIAAVSAVSLGILARLVYRVTRDIGRLWERLGRLEDRQGIKPPPRRRERKDEEEGA